MKRRDLFDLGQVFRALPGEGRAAATERRTFEELCRLAMERGIDPANETVETLSERLGLRSGGLSSTTQRGR